jgi:hypothetical protein
MISNGEHCRQIHLREERPLNLVNMADPVTVCSLVAIVVWTLISAVVRIAHWWRSLYDSKLCSQTTFRRTEHSLFCVPTTLFVHQPRHFGLYAYAAGYLLPCGIWR